MRVESSRQDAGEVPKSTAVYCIVFGAPFLGDVRLQRVVETKGWRRDFLNVVSRHDIVPRLLIAKLQGDNRFLLVFTALDMFSQADVLLLIFTRNVLMYPCRSVFVLFISQELESF